MTIYVDHTHLGRHVTGLERITQELFSEQALKPPEVTPVAISLRVRTEQGATIMPMVWNDPLEIEAAISPGA